MIVVTGAVAFDYSFSFPGRFADQILPEKIHVINMSFVVDRVERRFGGTGGNQAYSLGLLETNPILLASVGYDSDPYVNYLGQAGVNIQYIVRHSDILTASGFVLADRNDNQIWGFAKNAMVRASNIRLENLKNPVDFVLISPDEFKAIDNHLAYCQQKKIPYAFDPAFDIPKLSLEVLKRGIEHATIVFGNDYEIAILKKRTGMNHETLTRNRIVVTTLAQNGSIIEKDQQRITIKPAKLTMFVSPIGAGDAYRAGFLAGYLRGYNLAVCGRMGSVAAVYAIEHAGTVEHKFSKEEFMQRYKQNYKEKLIL